MDRIDAMQIFVAALDEGNLARAGRKLGRSPAAVSRALSLLETHVGVELLHRTTRSIKLSTAGEHYALACRQVLNALKEAETLACGDGTIPRGMVSLTAPIMSGEDVLRPIVDEFLDEYPSVSAKLQLVDRLVNLIEEGVDVALRIGELPDSSMVAVRVGQLQRIVAAAPSYLSRYPPLKEPGDLVHHRIIVTTPFGSGMWNFPPADGTSVPRLVRFTPRLVVDTARAAIASAVEGRGVIRLLSYQAAEYLRDGRLQVVLKSSEHPPVPVHVVTPQGRLSVPKVRAFVDYVVPRLRARFARLTAEAGR